MSVLVVAEPGCTHQGDYETMLRLIDAAAKAGANVFKNQWMSNPQKVRERRRIEHMPSYDWLSYPLKWHELWAAECKNLGMEYACTSYLPEDVWQVDPYVSRHKVSSFENQDQRLTLTAIATGKPVMVSLGMATFDVIDGWRGIRREHPNLSLLWCNSAYPAPKEQAALGAIREYALDGYSDHTRCLTAGAGAVHWGARAVEAHIRLDDCDPENPDYATAFVPIEFTEYVQHIRDAEQLIEGVPTLIGLRGSEAPMLRYKVSPEPPPRPPAELDPAAPKWRVTIPDDVGGLQKRGI